MMDEIIYEQCVTEETTKIYNSHLKKYEYDETTGYNVRKIKNPELIVKKQYNCKEAPFA